MAIQVTTSSQQVTANVADDKITATVSAGFGATGPSGVVNVSAPITNSGTTTAANIGLAVGTGLAVSGGSLVTSYGNQAGTSCQGNDSRLSDSREWSADTVSQAEAEAGTASTRRAFTALRVFQAIAAWWNSSAAKTKLDGIANGATANQTDAHLLSRANHTGTQTASTISDFAAAVVAAAPPTTDASLLTQGTLSASRLPASGVTAGTYTSVTVDTTGRVTVGGSHTVSWDDVSSKPATFAPSSHTHTASAITDFNSAASSAAPVQSVAGRTGAVTLAVADVSDAVSTSDARLSDARTPTSHKASHATGGSDALTAADIGAAATSHAHAWSDITSGVPSSFAPSAHKTSHATGGSDALTAADIGAAATSHTHAASDITSGTLSIDRLPVGTGSTQVAAGNHTHAQLHDRSHAMTGTSDHTATNWRLFHSNGSGAVVELAFGNSGQALISNGASAAPSWGQAGSTSASDLTSGTLDYARMADPTVTSPSQITSNQNNYASFARGINRFTTDAARNLTGMVAGSDGEVRVLTNVGTTAANTLTLKDESADSTAGNRISVPWNGDFVIPAEGSAVLFYDNTSSRWRVV